MASRGHIRHGNHTHGFWLGHEGQRYGNYRQHVGKNGRQNIKHQNLLARGEQCLLHLAGQYDGHHQGQQTDAQPGLLEHGASL